MYLIIMYNSNSVFPFDMSILRAGTTKHPYHGLIQNMFCCMHGRIFLFVMFI